MAEKTYVVRMLIRIAVIVTTAALLIVFAPFAYKQWHTFANTMIFEPVLCTGDWDTDQGFPKTRSTGQTWFCSFAALTLEQPEEVSSATLTLSFVVSSTQEEEMVDADVSHTNEVIVVPQEPAPDSLSEHQEGEVAGIETQEESISEEVIRSEEETVTPTPDAPEVETGEQMEPKPAPVSEEAPETLSRWFFGIPSVFAQTSETPPTEIAEPSSEELLQEVPSTELPTEETESDPLPLLSAPEEVLGESDESSVPLVEEVSTVAALSYTTDGTVWTYIDSIPLEEGVHTFPIEILDTNDLERLVVRLVTESIEKNITVTLSKVSLTLVTIPETVEPVILEIATENPTLPLPRSYEREFTIDPYATHSCAPSPSAIDLSDTDSRDFSITLTHGTSTGQEVVELGSMPYGIDLTFTENDAYRFVRAERVDALSVHVATLPGAQQGSMSIPVIYRKEVSGKDSFTTCQINIINI